MKLPRMFDWIIVTILLTVLIYVLAPQQLPVSLYKLSLITTAAVVGYWIDRSLFPYARPDKYLETPFVPHDYPEEVKASVRKVRNPIAGWELVLAAALLRRAIIVGCAMLAVSLGV